MPESSSSARPPLTTPLNEGYVCLFDSFNH
jgi:hypothetical protein